MPDKDEATHSNPIPIDHSASHHRRRSGSVSSDDSASPTTPLTTPISTNLPKVSTASPSTSPILSYFMSTSPTSKNFPFRRGFGGSGSAFEEESPEIDPLHNKMPRRASTAWVSGDRFQSPPISQFPDRQERASGLFRRLSLSTPFTRPSVVTTGFGAGDQNPSTPPNTAYPKSPTNGNGLGQQNSTLSPGRKPVQRSPSPMGERILKGHFDGFN